MAQVPYTSFYQGPFAVYTSPTGMQSQITNTPYLGGSLHEGDYCDLQAHEAAVWNQQFGSKLNAGRYRLVKLSPLATAANVGYGKPVSWGLPQVVGQVALSVAGSGATTDGTYVISSSTSGGTAKATALATVSGGVITAVQLTFGGAGFTSVPTFGLTEIAGLSSGSVLAQMAVSSNLIGSFEAASSISLINVRGIGLTTVTSAQVTAGAWLVIQEEGIAPVLVATASGTPAAGNGLTAATAAAVTSNSTITNTTGFIGYALDLPAASTVIRADLYLPPRQG